jgi:hypothetical protein
VVEGLQHNVHQLCLYPDELLQVVAVWIVLVVVGLAARLVSSHVHHQIISEKVCLVDTM